MDSRSHGRGRRRLTTALLGLAALCVTGTGARANIAAPEVEVMVSGTGGLLGTGGSTTAWAVSLTADKPVAQTGEPITLTAQANKPVDGTNLQILIYDMTLGVPVCEAVSGDRCPIPVTRPTTGIETYQAFIAGGFSSSPPPPGVHASSNQLAVAWVATIPTPTVNSGPGYSDRCTAPTQVVADGWSGNIYERVLVQATPQTALVCFRVLSAQGAGVGGDIELTAPSPTLGVPTVDNDGSACKRTSSVPPFPIVQPFGPFGDQDDTSVYFDWTTAEWCLNAGSQQEHVAVPISNGPAPQYSVNFDQPEGTNPVPVQGPAGQPSSQCQENGGTLLYDGLVGGVQVSAFAWQKDADTVVVCERISDRGFGGGALTFTAPGANPRVGILADTSGCDAPIENLGAVRLSRSSGLDEFCIDALDNHYAVLAGPGLTGDASFAPDTN